MPKFLDDIYIQRNGYVENLSNSINDNYEGIEKLRRSAQHNVFIKDKNNTSFFQVTVLEASQDPNTLVTAYKDLDDFLNRTRNVFAFLSYPCTACDISGTVFNFTNLLDNSKYGSFVIQGHGYKYSTTVNTDGATGRLISDISHQVNVYISNTSLNPLIFKDVIVYPLYT